MYLPNLAQISHFEFESICENSGDI